jgi:hypothetical protein
MKMRAIKPGNYRVHPWEAPTRALEVLHQATLARFADPVLATLWETTSQPRLHGQRPADFVKDQPSLDACLAVLARGRA